LSCGSFNSNGYTSSDGIYGEIKQNKITENQNGIYYKNYFDQKAEEYGLNEELNDSVITDVNSYSSPVNSSNLTYTDSYGSWGDNPSSVKIIYRDNYIDSYWGNYYGYNHMNYWNHYYSPHYSPFSYWNYYPYQQYGGFGIGYFFSPGGFGGYGGYYGGYYRGYNGYNHYNDPNIVYNNNIAYSRGRRGTNSNTFTRNSENINSYSSISRSKGSKVVKNYNVGRNEIKLDNNSDDQKNPSKKIIRGENSKRAYYVLRNSDPNNSKSVRGYQNQGDANVDNSIQRDKNIRRYSKSSNYQISRFNNNPRNVSRSNDKSDSSGRSGRSGINIRSNSSKTSTTRSAPPTRNYSVPRSSSSSVKSSSSSSSTSRSRGRR
jgi:hypothetical protein